MLQKKLWLYGLVTFGLFFTMVPKSSAQSVFRVSVWCLPGAGGTPPPPPPIYQVPSGEWRVKGSERDKLLNLGANHLFVCGNLFAEEAVVFMGDSLDSAPVRKEFKSTLGIVPGSSQPPVSSYWPLTMPKRGFRDKAITAQLFTTNPCNSYQPTWRCSVRVAYQNMYNHHLSRLDGVHSFFAAEEGCINKADHIDGINFMCDSSIVESFVQLGYVPAPDTAQGGCSTVNTYYMAGRLKKADHLMSGNYVFKTTTDTSGSGLQTQINALVASLRDAARGIKDSSSSAKFWGVFQTQQSDFWGFRWPTKNELLCEVNLSLAHGAKGISYYLNFAREFQNFLVYTIK